MPNNVVFGMHFAHDEERDPEEVAAPAQYVHDDGPEGEGRCDGRPEQQGSGAHEYK